MKDNTFDALLPTAYVVRREGYVLTHVCPAVCPHLGRGGTLARSRWGGGTPARSSQGGTPAGGTLPVVPHLRYPTSDLAGGGSVPCREGGTPPRVTDGVLDTPRSVCLLRSRTIKHFPKRKNIRTFLSYLPLH